MPRSIDQRFLVKFSAAPYVGAVSAATREPTSPTQREDYRFVLLSSFSAKETRRFSESLFLSLATSHNIIAQPNEVLGESLIDDGAQRRIGSPSSRYQSRGAYQKRFEALLQSDASFGEYATSKGINVADLTAGTENERAALVRKIIWPVLIREEFLFKPAPLQTKSRRRLRSATAVSDIYTGAGSIFAICEGNPRQLISLLEPMLRSIRLSADQTGSVRRSLQKELIERAISAYFALVSTVPTSKGEPGVGSLVDLISIIGWHFRETVLGKSFNPDPVLSFEIDEGLSPSVKQLVGRGINLGAFVLADVTKSADSPYRLGDVIGLKARLSNIFAPHYRLPLAGGRTIRLSTILKRRNPQSEPLLELFGTKI